MTGEASDNAAATGEPLPQHLLPANYRVSLLSGNHGELETRRAPNMASALDAAQAMIDIARQRQWMPSEDIIITVQRDLSH